MANKPAVNEYQTIPLSVKCDSLSQTSRIILDSEILQGDVVGLDFKGVGSECPHFVNIGMIVVGDDGLVPILATKFYILQPLWDDKFLLVRTFLNIYNLMVVHESTADPYCLVYGAELSSSIPCYNDSIRVVVFACGCSE